MATLDLTRSSNGSITVGRNGGSKTYSGYASVYNAQTDTLMFANGDSIRFGEYSTINAGGSPVTGTPAQKWGSLSTSIFFLAEGGGKYGAAVLPYMVISDNVAHSLTGGVANTETDLVTGIIPGGALGPNGVLHIIFFVNYPSNTNTKTFKVKIGTNLIFNLVFSAAGSSAYRAHITLANRNATNSQVTGWDNSASTAGFAFATVGTFAIDTNVDQPFKITGTINTITDTITVHQAQVIIYPFP